MARPIRIEYEGAFYHGAAPGNGQRMICNWPEKGLNRSGLNCPESRSDPVITFRLAGGCGMCQALKVGYVIDPNAYVAIYLWAMGYRLP